MKELRVLIHSASSLLRALLFLRALRGKTRTNPNHSPTIAPMKLVLIGDIHMYRLFMAPWELAGKTLIGQANVWLNRRRHFDRKLLVPVVRRAMGLRPEMVLLSGDLTSVASSEEF